MQNRPSAKELLEAAAAFLAMDVAGSVPGEQRFKVLVAANVCAVAAREIELGESYDQLDVELFRSLVEDRGVSLPEGSDFSSLASELSGAIRDGVFDTQLDWLADRLREHVRRKLDIARPGYAA